MVAIPVAGALSLASTAIGGAVSAVGAIGQGQAAAASASYQAAVANQNAIIARQNATYATQAGNAQAEQQEMANTQRQGAIRAAMGASGLDVSSGSAEAVQSAQSDIGALNVMTVRNRAEWDAYGYQTQGAGFTAQAGLDTASAGYDTTAGGIGAVGSILGSASSLANQWQLQDMYGALAKQQAAQLRVPGGAQPGLGAG